MKKYVLVNKEDDKIVYNGTMFSFGDEEAPYCADEGQFLWYWVDVTGTSDINEWGRFSKTDFIPSETPDPAVSNQVLTGTWA